MNKGSGPGIRPYLHNESRDAVWIHRSFNRLSKLLTDLSVWLTKK
jgi:hypothetical protein